MSTIKTVRTLEIDMGDVVRLLREHHPIPADEYGRKTYTLSYEEPEVHVHSNDLGRLIFSWTTDEPYPARPAKG